MLLSEFIQRTRAEPETDGWVAFCPAHSDAHTPSLRIAVSPEGKVLLKCRANCKTADVLKALGLTFRDLATMQADVTELVARSGSKPASPANIAALRVRLDGYLAARTEATIAYARARFGITDADADRLELGTAFDLGGGERMVVPFLGADGVARGFQARALQADAHVRWTGPANPDGETWAKVGYLRGESDWAEVLVTEGPGDGLTAVGMGYSAVLIRGAGLSSNADVVREVADLVGSRVAVLAGDGDAAGQEFNANLAAGLSAHGVTVKALAVPAGSDLSKWRETAGTEPIYEAVQTAALKFDPADTMRDRDTDRYPLTNLGDARFLRDFVVAQGSGVRHTEQGFVLLDSGVWVKDRRDMVRTYAQQAADRTAEVAARIEKAAAEKRIDAKRLAEAESERADVAAKDARKITAEAKEWARHVERAQSTLGINSAVRELQALPEVSASVEQFDQYPDLLAVRNGVLDLRTGKLQPHNARLLLTKRVDIAYNPDARAWRWERFLTEIFPNHPELVPFMQRLVGYGITGRTDEQCLALMVGKGANGKSVLTDTLAALFDEITVTTPFSTFESKPAGGIPSDIAALAGARLVMASEGEANATMAEATLKRVTGKDRITARFLRQDYFTFTPSFLLMLASNHDPVLKSQDFGLWRRIKRIPFERTFTRDEQDMTLPDKLRKEAEGILAWAVAGAQLWYERGLQEPEVVKQSTATFKVQSDPLAEFLTTEFCITKDPDDHVTAKAVWDGYRAYSIEAGEQVFKQRRTFMAALGERGAIRTTKHHQDVLIGIRKGAAE